MAEIPTELKARLKELETELDTSLAQCAVYRMKADDALALLMHMSNYIAQQTPWLNGLDRGIDVLAPYLVSGAAGADPPDVERLFYDAQFAAHYFMVREYLYYGYNAPSALAWTFDENRTKIRFLDRSIPRQFFTSYNNFLLASRDRYRDRAQQGQLEARIGEVGEWEPIRDETLAAQLEAEAEYKLEGYFSILPPDSNVDLGGYSYAQFYQLYRMLVAKAMWHRMHAEHNGECGAIHVEEPELVEAARQELGLEPEVAQRILRDLVFDAAAAEERLSPAYFSLLRERGGPRIWLRPIHFCLHEGLVGILRVVAQRRPQLFLDRLSRPLGKGLVERMKGAFEHEGFRCLTDAKLADFDPTLPDIDLLVISEEPTLGYVILVCELKSPIPAKWAKDHLRALTPDGISKAFRQSERIGQFLTTDNGLSLIRRWLPKDGLRDFDHFVVVLQPLVITSHNSGMFFDQVRTPVFDYHTVERMLNRCDGDVAYVLHMLRTFREFIDANLVIGCQDFHLGTGQVSYDVLAESPVIDFPQNQWRSDGSDEQLVEEFIASGAKPMDCVFERLGDLSSAASVDNLAEDNLDDSTTGWSGTIVLFDGNLDRRGLYLRMTQFPELGAGST